MNLDKIKSHGLFAATAAFLFLGACSDDGGTGNSADGTESETGDSDSNSDSDSDSDSNSGEETDSESNSGDGDGDSGDGDGDSGDGDGDPATATDSDSGDGDGDLTDSGDGDGDPTDSGDGDGDMTGDGDGDMTGDGDGDMTGDGDGDMTGDGDGDGDACQTIIYPTYRDFRPLHPDFGCHMFGNGARPGLVMPTLGNDQKPVYNPNPPPAPGNWNGSNPQITSEATFGEWYNTIDDLNIEIAGEIELVETAPNSGIYSFASNMFYPLTDMGFGNNVDPNWAGETYPNWNGAFTTEIHVQFQYQPGQQFTYTGDDDVWVFIDGELVLDIGGLHGPVEDSVDLDGLGLQQGVYYDLDVFHAERCGSGSNFRIDTSISCIQPQ